MNQDNENKIIVQDTNKELSESIPQFGDTDTIGKHAVWFMIGLALAGMGLFLVFQNTTLFTNFTLMDLLGFTPPFGLVLLPLLIGIGVLFFNEKSIIGWILVIFGLITIVLGIIMGLHIFFRPVSLYEGILMFGLISGGMGMMAKALYGKRAL